MGPGVSNAAALLMSQVLRALLPLPRRPAGWPPVVSVGDGACLEVRISYDSGVRSWSRVSGAIATAIAAGCTLDSTGLATGGGVVAGGSTGTTTEPAGSMMTDPGLGTGSGADAPSATTSSGTGDETASGSTSGTGPEPTSDSSTGAPARCNRVLWVIGNTDIGATNEALFHQRLVERGYEITLVASPQSKASDVEDNCLVILSSHGMSGDLGGKFRDVTVPVLVMEGRIRDNMRMVEAPSDCGALHPADSVVIIDDSHPMAGGVSGTVEIYPPKSRVSWGIPMPTAQIVAGDESDETIALIFGFEQGDMLDGISAPARRVAFPANELNDDPIPAGVDLFEAAVDWALDE